MIKRILIGFVLIAAFSGCEKWYQVPEPSYVQVDDYVTKVVPTGQQGTANQNFTDMEVIANGTTYGIFPLGTQVPIIMSGDIHFLIKGVIEVNGVNALRSAYAEMKGCDTIINVQVGKVTHITPVFEYFASSIFPWLQDFDHTSSYNNNPLMHTNTFDSTESLFHPGMGGGKCMKFAPNDRVNQTVSQMQTKLPISLPAGGTGIYLEFNYWGNISMDISVQGVPVGGTATPLTSCGGVFPSATWTKIYIELTEQVSSLQSGYYYIYLTSLYNSAVGNNYMYVDNIKLVVGG